MTTQEKKLSSNYKKILNKIEKSYEQHITLTTECVLEAFKLGVDYGTLIANDGKKKSKTK